MSEQLRTGDDIDATEHGLLRVAHRILTSDIFDFSLRYLNERFVRYRDLALRAIREDFKLAESDTFCPFVDGRVPGGSTFAHAIVFNALQRLNAGDAILHDLNRPLPDGTARSTTLLKSVMEVNGGRKEASLVNFIPGRVIEIPAVRSDQPHVLDSEIARYFFESKHYYAQAIEQIETAIQALDRELQRAEIKALLER